MFLLFLSKTLVRWETFRDLLRGIELDFSLQLWNNLGRYLDCCVFTSRESSSVSKSSALIHTEDPRFCFLPENPDSDSQERSWGSHAKLRPALRNPSQEKATHPLRLPAAWDRWRLGPASHLRLTSLLTGAPSSQSVFFPRRKNSQRLTLVSRQPFASSPFPFCVVGKEWPYEHRVWPTRALETTAGWAHHWQNQ